MGSPSACCFSFACFQFCDVPLGQRAWRVLTLWYRCLHVFLNTFRNHCAPQSAPFPRFAASCSFSKVGGVRLKVLLCSCCWVDVVSGLTSEATSGQWNSRRGGWQHLVTLSTTCSRLLGLLDVVSTSDLSQVTRATGHTSGILAPSHLTFSNFSKARRRPL